MAEVKDWIKKISVGMVLTLIGLVMGRIFAFPDNVKEKFEETDFKIIQVEEKSKIYTDKAIEKHEVIEQKRDELLIKYLDDRFNGLEKLIDANHKK